MLRPALMGLIAGARPEGPYSDFFFSLRSYTTRHLSHEIKRNGGGEWA